MYNGMKPMTPEELEEATQNALLAHPEKTADTLSGHDLMEPLFNDINHMIELARGRGVTVIQMPIEALEIMMATLEDVTHRLDEKDAW